MQLLPLERMLAQLPPSYPSALDEIPFLTSCFNPVELITIDDLARVRLRFLRERKNPVFAYRRSTAALEAALAERGLTIDAIERRLHAIRESLGEAPDELASIYREAIVEKIDDDLSTIELYRGLVEGDDAQVKRAVWSKYGSVDDQLVAAAERMVEEVQPREPAGRSMTSEDLAAAASWMLERYYAHAEEKGRPIPEQAKFRVSIDPKYSSIDVRDKSSEGPVVGIPPKERSASRCRALLRHEIDQHARQSLNGQMMFGFGGGGMKIDEEIWYEGLAVQRDGSRPVPWYVLAIRMADEGKSFVEVFEAIRRMRRNSEANAWITTYRVFRGHCDTSNQESFGLPKDQAYLRGWMLQEELTARGLSHLNEAAVSKLGGIDRIARFDFGPDDLLLPDLDLAARWFEEAMSD